MSALHSKFRPSFLPLEAVYVDLDRRTSSGSILLQMKFLGLNVQLQKNPFTGTEKIDYVGVEQPLRGSLEVLL